MSGIFPLELQIYLVQEMHQLLIVINPFNSVAVYNFVIFFGLQFKPFPGEKNEGLLKMQNCQHKIIISSMTEM